jgi:hypothetical protein
MQNKQDITVSQMSRPGHVETGRAPSLQTVTCYNFLSLNGILYT